MAESLGSRAKRGALIAVGAFAASMFVEHLVWPAISGDESLEQVLSNRIDSVAVGQPFNKGNPKGPGDGLRLEVVQSPNASGLGAAFYNAYENSGANNPTKPEPRLRAAVACSTLVLNEGHLSKVEIDDWSTAQRNNGQNGDHNLADHEFTRVADECTKDVLGMLGGAHPAGSLAIPVDKG